MDWVGALLDSRITLISSALLFFGFMIFSFVKGWVLTLWQVKQLLEQSKERADEYKELWQEERDQKIALVKQLDQLSVVGETQLRILHAMEISTSKTGDTIGEVTK